MAQLKTTPRVVTIGGGSGSFMLLRGLRDLDVEITAICTVFDNGGSTGKLRSAYGALPQGDIRRCITALIPDEKSGWRHLLEQRFEDTGNDLSNHSIGNLLLRASERLVGPAQGSQHLGELIGIKGKVLPVSISNSHLMAELDDGMVVETESAIDKRNVLSDDRKVSRVWLKPDASACADALEAISRADMIVIGPGDLYTSIIPNLLVNWVPETINASDAKLVFVTNIMTKGAETRGYRVIDFLQTLRAYGIDRKIDVVLHNSCVAPERLLKKYKKEHAEPVDDADDAFVSEMDRIEMGNLINRFLSGDLLSRTGVGQDIIRHSSKRLAAAIMQNLGY